MRARVLLLCNWCLEILTVIRILCRLYLHLICSLHGKAVVLFLGKNEPIISLEGLGNEFLNVFAQ